MKVLALGALAVASGAGTSKDFPPGWNGLARTPPMGWRSWNAFGNRITQDMMMDAAHALAAKNRTVRGWKGEVSLCDLGYCSVGVDEGWEGCGAGVNKTQHDAAGIPTIDDQFPDTAKMVDDIHALDLAAGWYLNGCKCGEHVELEQNYAGDITSTHKFNFDGVKIDGCGKQLNMTLYAALMRDSGKNYTIENCHWGDCTDSDDSSCPTKDWCPFNWYRTSGDINAGATSWLSNLQTTTRFQDYDAPLSVPGCWAYPDMLEVGRVAEPAPGAGPSWNRAHFGAWCIVSAPLILGLELTDENLTPILDVIGNKEAVAVNQAWAGHPGMLVQTIVAPPQPFDPAGPTTVPSSAGSDFDTEDGAGIGSARGDDQSSGAANIRTGGPGGTGLVRIGTGLVGAGHAIAGLSMQFRYSAGYTPGAGEQKAAPVVKVQILDMATSAVLATVFTSPPLGKYSYDHFTQYSPPIVVKAAGLHIPTDKPVIIALSVANNQRNLQIPVDDKANGFAVSVTWAAPAAGAAPHVGLAPYHGGGFHGQGQLWAKPQPKGGAAALLINQSPDPIADFVLDFSALNLTAGQAYTVRDIWEQKDVGTATGAHNLTVPAYDSAFVLLTPA